MDPLLFLLQNQQYANQSQLLFECDRMNVFSDCHANKQTKKTHTHV